MHNPPTMGISDPQRQLDVLITTGSQDGICKVCHIFLSFSVFYFSVEHEQMLSICKVCHIFLSLSVLGVSVEHEQVLLICKVNYTFFALSALDVSVEH